MKRLLSTIFSGFFCCFIFGQVSEKIGNDTRGLSLQDPTAFLQTDGPYIIGDTLYRVNARGQLVKRTHYQKDAIHVEVPNVDADAFKIALTAAHKIPVSSYPLPSKLIAISDIEGEFDAFIGFLIANKVVDQNLNWIFGTGHLVLLGDFVDRGKSVTQTLWLIYKLEQEALLQEGMVHFILGNHEVFNFRGDYRYNDPKYVEVAKKISGYENKTEAVKFMYSNASELGNWLSKKNIIEKIGKYWFVHGGLSKELLTRKLTIQEINDKVRSAYYMEMKDMDVVTRFLYGQNGPFWYRGLVLASKEKENFSTAYLDDFFRSNGSSKVVVGHTHVNSVSLGFDGKVIMLDVPHGRKKFSGKTKGLLIEKGVEFAVDDKGVRCALLSL